MNPVDSFQAARLYGILDMGYCRPEKAKPVLREMIEGGIDVVQLRAKNSKLNEIRDLATRLIPICREAGVPFVVNDFARIAAEIGADAVHVGQDDAEMDRVREIVGDDMNVGRSTHSLEQAAAAAEDSRTNYIGFGPLFSTPTKPEYKPIGTEEIQKVHENHPNLPIFCIGGIKLENVDEVIAAGAKRVVIVSGILQATDIAAYVGAVQAKLA
ncbi:MAG: thiamine phosphate synthase [Verrucomicrobiales bacterium]|nr:thiamine phosphate synthase [Verrucomicrobiales bacterium]